MSNVIEVKLPDLGEGVTEGELIKWLVKEGDSIEMDQPFVELMTDKATVEIPSPYSGVVNEFKFSEGDLVQVESTLLTLTSQKTSQLNKEEKENEKNVEAEKTDQETITKPKKDSKQESNRVKDLPITGKTVLASPGTRKLAREKGIDINQVKGSGPVGRVIREDIEGYETQPQIKPEQAHQRREERVPLRGVRKIISESMRKSKQLIPHFTHVDQVEVDKLVKMREELKNQVTEVKITYLPIIIKSLLSSLRDYPELNASIDEETKEIVYKKYYNIGFAADTPSGLMVPVIQDADKKSILQISKEIIDLSGRAKEGKLKREEMLGSTFTVTNIGTIGGQWATPIINHPEVAMLGIYKIQIAPKWENDQWIPKKVMNFSITCDHRLIDGAVAARFLNSFMDRIKNPEKLILDLK